MRVVCSDRRLRPVVLLPLLCLTLLPLGASTHAQAPPRPELVLHLTHQGSVRSVAYSRDGRTLASLAAYSAPGRIGTEVIRWDTGAGTRRSTLLLPHTPPEQAVLSPDGALLIAPEAAQVGGIRGLHVIARDTGTGKQKRTFEGGFERVTSLAFSRDGRFIAAAGTVLRENQSQPVIRVWDARAGQLQRSVETPADPFARIAVSPDGRLVAAAVVGDDKSQVRLWDVGSGQLKSTLAAQSRWGEAAAFSPDGKLLVTVGDGVQLWDAETGELKRTLMKSEFAARPALATFSPDGKSVAVTLAFPTRRARYAIQVLDVETGKPVGKFGMSLMDSVGGVVFSPDGDEIAVGNNARVVIGDVASGAVTWDFDRERAQISDIAFSPDGRTLAHTHAAGTVRLWDAQTGELKRTVSQPVRAIAFSPDSKTLAITGAGLALLDLESGKLRQLRPGPGATESFAAFSPDGKLLAVLNRGGLTLWNPATGEPVRTLGVLAQALAFSPDGKMLVAGGGQGQDASVHVWDTGTWELKRSFVAHRGYGMPLAFSADGATLATGGHYNMVVKLWDTRTWELKRTLGPFPQFVEDLALTRDGSLAVVSAYTHSVVSLWDLRSGEKRHTLEEQQRDVTRVADFTPDGKALATAGDDGPVRLWDPATGKLRATLQVLPSERADRPASDWIVYTPEGYFTGSPGARQFILWRVGEQHLPVGAHEREFRQPDRVRRALR